MNFYSFGYLVLFGLAQNNGQMFVLKAKRKIPINDRGASMLSK